MTTPRPAPHPSEGAPTDGALGSVRILDLTDQRAIYGAKLLADLGATVIRIEPPEGDPLRRRGPRLATSEAPPPSATSRPARSVQTTLPFSTNCWE